MSRSAEGSPCPVDRLTCRFASAIAAGVVGAVWASVRGGPSCASAGIGSGGRCEQWGRGSCCAQAGAVHGCGLTRMEYYNEAGPHIWVTRGPFTSNTSMARPGHNVPIHRSSTPPPPDTLKYCPGDLALKYCNFAGPYLTQYLTKQGK